MSILIKGMEMPMNCYICNLCNYYNEPNQGCYCVALRADLHSTDIMKERAKNCPLIELPPHGRLGDLDRLERMFADIDNAPYSGFDGTESFYSAEDAAQIIRLAPTVIPGEESES